MAYLGVEPGSRSIRTSTVHTATAGQNTFNVTGGYMKGYVDVYVNGTKTLNFSATDNQSVVLSSNASLNDKVEIIAYAPLAIYSTVSKSGDAMGGDLTLPNLIATANVGGANGYFNNLKINQNTYINNSLTVIGNTTQTGSLTLTGNLNLTGSLIITGEATSVTTSSLSVEDSIITMAANNVTGDTLDIGFAGKYNNGSANVWTGLIRNATDKEYYFFQEYDTTPGNDVDITDLSFQIANVHANFSGNVQSNNITVVQLNATNLNMTSSITLTGEASGYRQNSTTVYGGDAGAGFGRIEYYADKWVFNAGSDSANIAFFQRGNLLKSWIDNDGNFSATANNANNLGGVAAASFLQTSGSYTISGTRVHTANIEVRSANLIINTSAGILANGTIGLTGQVLTSNGSTAYWSYAGVNTAAQYTWTNTHTFQSTVTFGNSTVNSTVNSTILVIPSVTANLTGNVVATTISGNLTGNVVATTISGNLTGNVVGNVTATTLSGNLTGNVAAVTITGNLTGNVVATTISGNLTGNVAAVTITGNLTGNVVATSISGNLAGNVFATTVNSTSINATSHIHVGSNVYINTSVLTIGNATANIFVNSTAFAGNTVGVHVGNVTATTLSGNLTGNVVAVTISGNLTGNVAATTISGNLTGNVSAVTISSSANIAVGANVLITTANLAIGNSTANVYVNSTAFVGNTVGVHNGNVTASTLSGNLTGNVAATTITGNLTGNVIATNVNAATVQVSSSITLDNDNPLRFKTKNTAAVAYFVQQNDDNFVFYTTDNAYAPRPVFSIYANSATSALGFGVPVNFTGANVNLGTVALYANGGAGAAGQALLSTGTSTYWGAVAATINVAAQYAWTNTHTFSANVSFTGNGIGIASNTGAIYLGGIADANWKIGRNTGVTTKWKYTNNTIDIITANSNLEGMAIGLVNGNTYFETGYLGTFIASNTTVGNSTSNVVINSTAFVGNVIASSISGNLTGNVSGTLFGNVQATTLSGNLTGNVVATTVNATTINATSSIVVGANVSINTTVIQVGNSTVRTIINTTAFTGNVVATTITGNLTGNVVATTISGNLTGNVAATTISGNLTAVTANVTDKLQIGTPGSFDFGSNAVIEIDANGNTYVQSVIQNANTGNNASTDLVVTNDSGNDSFNYVDLGINGSNYNQPGYSISGPSDAYLYASHGNLAIGTAASDKELIFHAGGTTTSDKKMSINSTVISISTNSSVSAWINSTSTITAVDFNSTSDARFKSDIVVIDDALGKVKQLSGYTFIMNETGERSTGLIAQEVEKVLPEAVRGSEEKKTLSYGNIVGLLVEAIKEQNKKIERLENLLNK